MHSRMQAYTLVGYFIMFGDYAWQRAVPEDEAYDCFVEGRHIEAKPWKSMPAPILQFYNAGLDGRREARATIDELLDMVDSCDFAAQINTMRMCVCVAVDVVNACMMMVGVVNSR
eukprot:m.325893 g.325893  ORF g.325893 m.325893 type:complete len:115 (+) comp20391_c0_seq3:1206-1550(+)